MPIALTVIIKEVEERRYLIFPTICRSSEQSYLVCRLPKVISILKMHV